MGKCGIAAVAAIVGLCLGAGAAHAGNRFAFEPALPEITRAYEYASMSAEFCLAELNERSVPYERVAPLGGVQTPLRLTGPVRGVRFVQTYRLAPDPQGPAAVLDCPLALALDDFAAILARYHIVELEYLSLYRTGRFKPGWRHPAGRAIDVATLRFANGVRYSVHRDFLGRVGAQTCGLGARLPRYVTVASLFWRAVVCELHEKRSFNLIITPNYDWGHRDHLHLEVRSGIRWFLTQ